MLEAGREARGSPGKPWVEDGKKGPLLELGCVFDTAYFTNGRVSLSLFFSSPSRIHQLGVDSGMQEADKLHSSEDRIWAFWWAAESYTAIWLPL